MSIQKGIVIVAAKRTPIGGLMGKLSSLSAPHLAALTHQAALTQSHLDPKHIDESIMGCVLQAGIGQAPARQAVRLANLPDAIGATTLNKMCGSGLKAVLLAHDMIAAQSAQCILAGGMENMSLSPHLLLKSRQGYRLGHQTTFDHMLLDGLEDAYERGKLMGCFADETAAHYGFTREAQDAYAAESMQRALNAQKANAFQQEIIQVGDCTQDELPHPDKLSKLQRLKPSFTPNGTVTPGNSSAISDGACSLILMSEEMAKTLHIKPLAKIIAHASHAEAPEWFTRAPVGAIQKVLQKAHWSIEEVDLFEINEAFAVVTLLTMQLLNIEHTKINCFGGACALGHPIGASGARILTTLLYALETKQQHRGIASLCIGGGEACAIAIERCL